VKHDEIGSEKGILDRIERVVRDFVGEARIDLGDLERIGIGLPGQVDYRTGLLLFAPGLKLRNINVSGNLESRLSLPVRADNDVNCATLAELRFGHGRVFRSFVCVYVGTGIGAGMVINGDLYRGSNFAAGEIGHMKIDCGDNARLCTCGGRGCFEEYASARAIIRMAREKIFEVRERRLDSPLGDLDPSKIDPEHIVNAIRQNDIVSIELAERVAFMLAKGLANVANILNPDAIILGGGIIEGFYRSDFINNVFYQQFRANVLDVCSNTQILLSPLGATAPSVGASALGLEADTGQV
jgi:glucokinase